MEIDNNNLDKTITLFSDEEIAADFKRQMDLEAMPNISYIPPSTIEEEFAKSLDDNIVPFSAEEIAFAKLLSEIDLNRKPPYTTEELNSLRDMLLNPTTEVKRPDESLPELDFDNIDFSSTGRSRF